MLGAALFLGPFVWTVITSLKDASEIQTFPPTFLPAEWNWENYVQAWTRVPFGDCYRNTIIVVTLSTLGEVISTTLVAYGFARFRFRFRNALFMLVLSTLMIPPEVTIIPSFLLFRSLGWLDTWLPLIVPHWFGVGAFYIFLMRQFFMTIPRDFDEAAQIDGAGSLRVLRTCCCRCAGRRSRRWRSSRS